jgi:hypothetical protein
MGDPLRIRIELPLPTEAHTVLREGLDAHPDAIALIEQPGDRMVLVIEVPRGDDR